MAALWIGPPYETGQAIIFWACGFRPSVRPSSSFFPRLISAVTDWMSAVLAHMVSNLGCRSETCYMRLAENTGPKKSRQNCHLGTIAQLDRLYLRN